jgi:hypothetical protein
MTGLMRVLSVLLMASLGGTSIAQTDLPRTGVAPLGPPRPPVPITAPVGRNAFPQDILARMRAGLVAQAENPRSRPAPRPSVND